MAKETTHRADELKSLGWTADQVSRYTELWDYRQRWGAINLEREDRQFLRKAESVLPKIVTGKSSIKKNIKEKSYYRRILFFLNSMNEAEERLDLSEGHRGVWPILLEEELRILDYYEPVLGLPDTLKAKQLVSFREEIVELAVKKFGSNMKTFKYDFRSPLEELRLKEDTKWHHLRDSMNPQEDSYPVLETTAAIEFRIELRTQLVSFVRALLPSLADSDKPDLPDDWTQS